MKHEKLLTNFEQTIGKTVAGASVYFDEGWIRFTDGTAIVWDATGDEDGADMNVNADPKPDVLHDAGIITLAEWRAAEAEIAKARLAINEAKDRAEFERLRKKFEPTVEAKP